MKYASDFRTIARDSLRGRWTLAVIAGLIASLLGAASSQGPRLQLNFTENDLNIGIEYANQQLFSTEGGFLPQWHGLIAGSAAAIALAAIAVAVLFFILGSVVDVGYSKFNLDLVDRRQEPVLGTLFGYFRNWKTVTLATLLQTVYIFLWSLLLVIPGIVASYSYAMTGYILAENQDLSPSQAIEASKQMMEGNRWRLFCLNISFIGWDILAALTLGIGSLWLNPYKRAATAAFYREVSGTWRGRAATLPEGQ